MTNTHPKILVGCPTHVLKADSLEQYINGITSLTYTNYDIIIEDNSPTNEYVKLIENKLINWKNEHPTNSATIIRSENNSTSGRERMIHGRNEIRKFFLNEKYDYYLSLEQDVVPPTDVIERLLANKKDICSGVYLNQQTRDGKKHLVIMAGIWENENNNEIVKSIGFLDIFPSRLMKIAYAGMGCVLISRNVLEKVTFRYNPTSNASDDIYFARDAQSIGFTYFLDTSVLCKHYFNDAFKKTQY